MTLFGIFNSCCERHPSRDFLASGQECWSYARSRNAAQVLERGLRATGIARTLVQTPDAASIVHLLLASAKAGVQLAIASQHLGVAELVRAAATVGCDEIIVQERIADLALQQHTIDELTTLGSKLEGESASTCDLMGEVEQQAEIVIFTTGTTGQPKAAQYRWTDLLAQARRRVDHEGGRWGLLYQMNHFAGFQMLCHVLANEGTLVIVPNRDVHEVAKAFQHGTVTCVSATPTFWRMFLGGVTEIFPALRQITLGGEVAKQDLLDRLRDRFPNAVITHVYATTELGSCFSVSDGLAGFPTSLLDDKDRAVQLTVIDDELHVRSPYGMRGYVGREVDLESGWIPTGDLVEVAATRSYFRGRKSDVINVGGVKVQPAEIEEVIQTVPGVQLARAYGQPNPISGYIVAVDVVPLAGTDSAGLESAVRARCRETLDRYKQPRFVRICDELPTSNFKVIRRNGTT